MADARTLRDAADEATSLACKIGSAATDVVLFMTELVAELPMLKPALGTLSIVCKKVDTVRNLPEELAALSKRCTYLTACVIVKHRRFSSQTNVALLEACLKEVAKCIEQCGKRGRLLRVLKASHDNAEIARLNESLGRLAGDLGLAGIAILEQKVDTILNHLQPGPKLAAVPNGVPMGQSWHTTRDEVMDRVCEILGRGRGPSLAALAGRSGSGKTTAAAAMVGERGPIRPRVGETEDQARARMDRVRALFPDGVVWLRVGKGEGATDRLPVLMEKLTTMFRSIASNYFVPPVADKDDACYMKRVVSQEALRCLVVADDVWEASVVDKLRETGMWVLLTTRDVSIVEPHEAVMLDELTEAEAEGVLRGAARLPAHERLNDDAVEVLKICGYVAMDVAFVGSWSSVRTGNDGVPKSREAWADVIGQIMTEVKAVRNQVERAGEMGNLEVNRLAVLRAGFRYLGAEHPLAQELYLALAVFPDGHAFDVSDAALLMKDDESCADQTQITMDTVVTLERWAVVRASTSTSTFYDTNFLLEYHMHEAHVEFAREKLMDRGDIRKQAVRRWTSHISQLENIEAVDLYALLAIWNALERVGGSGWWVFRPYDALLVIMDPLNPRMFYAVVLVAQLYEHSDKQAELVPLMRKVIEVCDKSDGGPVLEVGHRDGKRVAMVALWYLGRSLLRGDCVGEEHTEVTRRMAELTDHNLEKMPEGEEGGSLAQSMTAFNTYGYCAWAAGRPEDAEILFRKARSLHRHADGNYSQLVFARYGLGLCLKEKGRWQEASDFFLRALWDKRSWFEDRVPQVAITQVQLGTCLRMVGRLAEAEDFLKQALKTFETRPECNRQTALTLHELEQCARDGGRSAEAETFSSRAWEINEKSNGNRASALDALVREPGV